VNITLSNWLSIAAAVIACGSVILAWKSYKIARDSHRLALETAQLSKPNLTTYLIDAFRYRANPGEKIVYVFCVSLENKSTVQNSVVAIEMRLPFVRDGIERLAVFQHSENFSQLKKLKLKNIIHLPATISVRGALIGNCCFEVPGDMLEGAEFDLHTLRFRCAEGSLVELEPKIIMDIVNVQYLEEKRRAGVPL
jgi:hypothetical protein